jgi:hypothetical protein
VPVAGSVMIVFASATVGSGTILQQIPFSVMGSPPLAFEEI